MLLFRIPNEPLARGTYVSIPLSLVYLAQQLGCRTALWSKLGETFALEAAGDADACDFAAAAVPRLADEVRELRTRWCSRRREEELRDGVASPRDRTDALAAAEHAALRGSDPTRDHLDALLALCQHAADRGAGLRVTED